MKVLYQVIKGLRAEKPRHFRYPSSVVRSIRHHGGRRAKDGRDAKGLPNVRHYKKIAGRFLEEEDSEAMQEELKEAFRLYDREGNGYITTATLKEILAALDDKLTSADLDGIIAEIDTDGSGTVDFDEFMEMMTGE
ncbi:Troponin C, isoallergen Bla g 6.0201 [Anthophora quadrimaculata]